MHTSTTTLVLWAVCLVGVARAAPQFAQPQFAPAAPNAAQVAPALSRTEQHDEAGQYTVSYTTYDGQTVNERGTLKQTPDGQDLVLNKDGSYQYISPEGTNVQVNWTADENGFHPQSPNLPVAPAAQPAFF